MFVDTGTLHAGAAESHRAGSRADEGANHLLGTSPVGWAHQQTLSDVGDQARTVATAFTRTEERNASELNAVRCNCAT